ncbi:acylphosphatase [Staphylococcus devriesei]|uniref:acylphosphatase n=1 Tax=Staphylococcus devriesei TaxID=586733 RepID=A0A2K4DK95_9STAP|nr:acylphosphatase [Staphylococcus devriesei]MCE5089659.1 acylphosphatase [Staphylococcus devriesei]MCE5097342.1 acylphosphatase [Staphylococcus devriesei]PNZ87241.1 acylphosphatase [Staphylococcus devriesei]PTE70634.1 acylphosphatase [Staphylococcus devriesei]PTF04677.1 acylphosphatase [Staphylococcus devriesei]
MQHKHLRVFGTVQGVGFRYYTQRLAHKYHIVGTVENVEDYVDIYAQGNEHDLEQFIDAVKDGASPASSVTDYDIEDVNSNGQYSDFKSI